MKQTFWMVWCEGGGIPAYKHNSEQSAIDEAERLARLHPPNEFVVLEAVTSSRRCDILTERFHPESQDPPF